MKSAEDICRRPSNQNSSRSVHITYDAADHEKRYAIREAVISLVLSAVERDGKTPREFEVLDLGCGIGLFMRDLRDRGFANVKGVDMDPRCVRQARQYGECEIGKVENILEMYGSNSFDIIIMSHVLEHIDNPIEALETLKTVTRRWIVLAVPNPLRPIIQLKYTLRSKNYSNKGHVFSWDRSHFENFLQRKNQLEIVEWATDRIRLIPFRAIRRAVRKVGLLDAIERRFLAHSFPYFSDSLIVLCRLGQD